MKLEGTIEARVQISAGKQSETNSEGNAASFSLSAHYYTDLDRRTLYAQSLKIFTLGEI